MPDAGGPGPRHGAAMAFDPSTGAVLLYGGWSGRPRDEYVQAGLAYDAAGKRLLLSGGGVVSGGQFVPGEGLWAWDGARWARVH